MSEDFSVLAGNVVTSQGRIENSYINISNGRIQGISAVPYHTDVINMQNYTAVPGFIDIHTHGYFGVDAFDSNKKEIIRWSENLARIGVTSFIPTCVSLKLDDLVSFLEKIRGLMKSEKSGAARILGARSEGPYISIEKKGAHNPDNVRNPSSDEIDKLTSYADVLRIMDMAPELEGFPTAMSRLENCGIAVSIGHTNGTFSEVSRGISSGARLMTHFYNAMTQMDHRSPGAVGAGFLASNNYLEIIADFHHVSREAIDIMIKLRGWDHIVAITDSLSVGGADLGKASLGQLPIEVHDGVAWIAGTHTIAGSILTMHESFSNLFSIGADLIDLVKAFSYNPAKILAAKDLGDIAPGKLADINFLDDEMKVSSTMISGKIVE